MLLNDHDDFDIYGEHLKNKRIALCITGGIAGYTAPKIIRALRRYSCEVFPYITEAGQEFVTLQTLAWASKHKPVTELTDKSEHLGQDGQTFDAVVVYPATYNFIGKMANGIADDCCSSLIASHISHAKIIYFPTMHGNMYYSPILIHNMSKLNSLPNVVCMQPRIENDKANVTDTATSVCGIVRAMSKSKLKRKSFLVTAGNTPVKIDNVRRITNKFAGKLGIEIANELYLQGADVFLLQTKYGVRPPKYIPQYLFDDYDEYKEKALEFSLGKEYGIFSSAVADYRPKVVVKGKIPSKGALTNIEMVNTEKVIDLVLERERDLYEKSGMSRRNMKLISFKYEEDKGFSYLLDVAGKRLKAGHYRVVANDISLNTDKQKCFLIKLDEIGIPHAIETAEGKTNIARMLVQNLENELY